MINQGTIRQEGDKALVIDPDGAGFVNQGLIEATGSGGLFLQSGTFTLGTGSTFNVAAGSSVTATNAILAGGTLSGNGTVDLNSATLDGVTLASGLDTRVLGNRVATLVNGLTNDSTLTLSSTGSWASLYFNGNQTLDGTGEIVMGGSAPYNQFRASNSNQVLTQAAGHTIRGHGYLLNNYGGMINQGTIRQEGDKALVIDPDGAGFVNEGTLAATGSGGLQVVGGYVQTAGLTDVTTTLTASGTLEIQGGSLAGTGTVQAPQVLMGGTLAPGTSPGTLTLNGDLNFTPTGILDLELGGYTQGSEYDLLSVSGDVSLDGLLQVSLFGGFTPTLGDTFTVLEAGGNLTGSFDSLLATAFFGGTAYQFDIFIDTNLDQVRLSLTGTSPVPLPPAIWLFLSGLLGFTAMARRRRPHGNGPLPA